MSNHLLNEAATARMLGLQPPTLRGWRFRQQGPTYCKIGGAVRYRLEDVQAFIAQAVVHNG